MYGFVRDGYQKQHRAIRALALFTASDTARRAVSGSLTRPLPASTRFGPPTATRYFLSAIYAVQYYQGVTE
jgi:hypothetical protein